MIVYGWLPSATKSLTPVAVTVCGAFQFVVLFNDAAATEMSSLSLHDAFPILTVFDPVGCEVRTTVKLPVDRSSPVVESVRLTVKPAESLSMLLIDTLVGLIAA